MKKLVSLLMAIAMVMGCAAGLADSAAGTTNRFGWEVPAETIKFTAYMGSDNPDTEAEKWAAMHDYLVENFNVDINLLVYDNDATERLNLMLSANDYPEVVLASINNSTQWIEQGRAVDLAPYIESDTCKDLVERYGKYLDRLYDDDGHVYALANSWGMSQWADYAPQVRYDWYVEAGSPDVSTPEKYYEALKTMIANHSTNANGEQTYAIGGYVDSSYSVVRTWLSMWGIKKFWKYDDENNLTYWAFTDEGLEMVKFINQINQDGLLDPDIFSMESKEFGDRVTNERYAGFIGNWWICGTYGHEKWNGIYGDKYNENMRYYHVNSAAEGKTATYNAKSTNGSRCIVTDKATDVEGIMKWFNFENTDLGTRLVGYGLPNEAGSVWNVAEDGTWEYVPEKVQQITTDTSTFDWDAVEHLGGQCLAVMSSGVEPLKDGTYFWFDQSNVDKWKVEKDKNLQGTFYDSGAFDIIQLPTDTDLPTIKTETQDIAMTALARAIYADTTEEAEAIIMQAREDLEDADIDQLAEYYSEQYKMYAEKWGL